MTGKAGFFISFEGGEGSGKTTQIALLADALRKRGHDVLSTREPGGTTKSETIRDMLVKRDGPGHEEMWLPESEALLHYTARLQHVHYVIKPALAAGKIVLCDRFADSTYAYQGGGQGCKPDFLSKLESLTLNGFKPDLTMLLDIVPEVGLSRATERMACSENREDKYEQENIDFHERLRREFLYLAASHPKRIKIIDAARDKNAIAADILDLALAGIGKAKVA